MVIFCPTDTWGGVEKNVRLRAKHMGLRGHKVTVVLLKGSFKERFSNLKNVTVENVKSRGGDLNILVVWKYFKLLKKIKPKTVFSALKKDWWLVSLAGYFANVSNIILYLGIKRNIRQGLKYKTVFKKLKARVLVNSDSLKNHLLESNPYFTKDNVFRIYNGFPHSGLKGYFYQF